VETAIAILGEGSPACFPALHDRGNRLQFKMRRRDKQNLIVGLVPLPSTRIELGRNAFMKPAIMPKTKSYHYPFLDTGSEEKCGSLALMPPKNGEQLPLPPSSA